MNLYWTSLLVGWVVLFAAGEAYALMHHTTTLSQFVWRLAVVWQPSVFLAGFVSGGLAVHFYWTHGG